MSLPFSESRVKWVLLVSEPSCVTMATREGDALTVYSITFLPNNQDYWQKNIVHTRFVHFRRGEQLRTASFVTIVNVGVIKRFKTAITESSNKKGCKTNVALTSF